jgi:NAD-dependent DNA ligase
MKKIDLKELVRDNKYGLVSLFLIASYAYYWLDDQVMEDSEYDKLCQLLYENYDEIGHQHKHLVDKEALKAGTAFQIPEKAYPTVVKAVAWQVIDGKFEPF